MSNLNNNIMRKILLLILLTFSISSSAQFIDATEIDSWTTSSMPISDYNLTSAYVYLLNASQLTELYKGKNLSKEERKELGLKKKDYPKYLYASLKMPNPLNETSILHFPLMLYDVKEKGSQKSVTNYGGKYLDKIPDEIVKRKDLIAEAEVIALKANKSKEFWVDFAKISVELGKTAINLSTTSGLSAITEQVMPLVNKGLSSLDEISKPENISSSFFVNLIPARLSSLYDEKVVSARLYQIHWLTETVSKSNVIDGSFTDVDELKNSVTNISNPYILIVNTKSEYNTSHTEIIFENSYYQKKEADWRRLRNPEKRKIENDFLQIFKNCLSLKEQVSVYNNSVNTLYQDWIAYARALDFYYQIKIDINKQLNLYKTNPFFISNYGPSYTTVNNNIDIWMKEGLLKNGQDIVNLLMTSSSFQNTASPDLNVVYGLISQLNFYRNIVIKTENQGKLPAEIKNKKSYALTLSKIDELEKILFSQGFTFASNISDEEKKELLITYTRNKYPNCSYCKEKTSELIADIDDKTFEENKEEYETISNKYYAMIDCYSSLETELQNTLNNPELELSDAVKSSLLLDFEKLKEYIGIYTKMTGQDIDKFTSDELSTLLVDYEFNSEKLEKLINRLKTGGCITKDCK